MDHDNQKSQKGKGKGKGKGKEKSNNSELKGLSKNPCQKHDSTHKWTDCPDYNPPTKVKGEAKGDVKSTKNDLHSTQATSKTTNKTPTVCINDKPEVKMIENRYASFNVYSSDKCFALMVQAKNNNQQVNCITVIEVPAKDRTLLATTFVINNCFTGDAIMSHSFAKSLGSKFQISDRETSYRTTAGNRNTQFEVTIRGVCLPHLSSQRTFTATIKIAPEESGNFGYGVIMGIGMMDKLGIDQSRNTKTITWGNNIEVPMVLSGFWTDSRIQTLCSRTNTELAQSENISHDEESGNRKD